VKATDFKIPEGWTIEEFATPNHFIVRGNRYFGTVTIDLKERGFRAGCSIHGALTSSGTYSGRNWKQALCSAAVRWLDDISNT
jgi:hypothetical protein